MGLCISFPRGLKLKLKIFAKLFQPLNQFHHCFDKYVQQFCVTTRRFKQKKRRNSMQIIAQSTISFLSSLATAEKFEDEAKHFANVCRA